MKIFVFEEAISVSRIVQISFLGRVEKTKGETGRYEKTTYRFGLDAVREASFFGLALFMQHQADHMVILGTAGSMWDALVEEMLVDDLLADEETMSFFTNLEKRVQQKNVDDEILQQLQILVCRRRNIPLELRIIPEGETIFDQLAILEILNDLVVKGDQVFFDITHAFRHLPITGVLAALTLRAAKGIVIKDIVYGKWMQKPKESPVVSVKSLITLADWMLALQILRETGDYMSFSELLQGSEIPESALAELFRASQAEADNNIESASDGLRMFLKAQKAVTLTGPAKLFVPQLVTRVIWAEKKGDDERRRALAWRYLNDENPMRAAIFGFEAIISRFMLANGLEKWLKNGTKRMDAKKSIESIDPKPSWMEHYIALKDIRNPMAHGGKIGQLNRKKLLKRLQNLFEKLLSEESFRSLFGC